VTVDFVGNNGNIKTVICEASYVCDTDEDSSKATFTLHDESVITNIVALSVLLDSGASMNVTKLRVPIKMEQSVRRYLDDMCTDDSKPYMINEQRIKNIAHLVDVRQRFGGSIEIIRKEDMYLGGSNTKFTLYKLTPYFNRAGVPGGADEFDTLKDVINLNIPGAYLYLDPTDDDYNSMDTDYDDFHAQDFR
jgi:hypothetical protein